VAQRAEAGERVALIDQGRGFDPVDGADFVLLAGDESALPAIVGILADLPRDTRGLAILEIPAAEDAQPVDAPAGVEVRWLPRADPHDRPGAPGDAAGVPRRGAHRPRRGPSPPRRGGGAEGADRVHRLLEGRPRRLTGIARGGDALSPPTGFIDVEGDSRT